MMRRSTWPAACTRHRTMKWILIMIALCSCTNEPAIPRGAPDLRPAFIGEESRCMVGSAFIRPEMGQERCDEYRCDTGWVLSGTVTWERRERASYQCRKTSPVPQNGGT